MDTYKKMPRLFWQFFQFGCFTFGGGWSIIAQMQKLYVEKEKTLTLSLIHIWHQLMGNSFS